MPSEREALWTPWKRLAGNLLPLLLSVPFLVLAVKQLSADPASPKVWLWAGCFLVIGWLSTNLLALLGNRGLRRTLELRLKVDGYLQNGDMAFVGFARPGHKGLLDPHEDVGFLTWNKDSIDFLGAVHRFSVPVIEISAIRFRPNIHTWLGLGRWLSIESQKDDRSIRLLLEPREKSTLVGNLLYSKKLRRVLSDHVTEVQAKTSQTFSD